jgi:hypothetical protein
MSFFSNFINGRRKILVQDSTVTPLPPEHATTTCASLLAASLFIGFVSLVGVFLNLAMAGGSASLPVSVSVALELGGSPGYDGCRKH